MAVVYGSSRGRGPELGFSDVLLTGLAPDGGLYLPTVWPSLAESVASSPSSYVPSSYVPSSYVDLATEVIEPFVAGAVGREQLQAMLVDAYGTFDHPDVCPLVQLDEGHHLMELFHGPTLAFKDIALQVVGRLFDHELERRQQRVMIVGATSGDTGSAAMEAVRGSEHVDIVVLFPHGRTTEVQRRQMTTLSDSNVHAVAVQGTFDDCQDLVKAMFNDEPFRLRHSLAAVNSINWARVMVQIVYYVWAVQQLDRGLQATTFCVPTGNFGNVFSGHVAARMGLNVNRFLVASNRNDILSRLIETGEMRAEEVVPTLSPSMDIQISSNLERLLYELLERNGPATAELIAGFRDHGRAALTEAQHRRLTDEFAGDRIDDSETLAIISEVYDTHGMLIDPHTAVGIGVAQRHRQPGEHVVSLATAHPAKFPDAVEQATGVRPDLPPHLADIFDRCEDYAVLPNDLATVEDFVDGLSVDGLSVDGFS